MKKRIICLIVCAALVMSMLPVFAATYDSEKLTLSKQSMGNTGAVISAELSCAESCELSAA